MEFGIAWCVHGTGRTRYDGAWGLYGVASGFDTRLPRVDESLLDADVASQRCFFSDPAASKRFASGPIRDALDHAFQSANIPCGRNEIYDVPDHAVSKHAVFKHAVSKHASSYVLAADNRRQLGCDFMFYPCHFNCSDTHCSS